LQGNSSAAEEGDVVAVAAPVGSAAVAELDALVAGGLDAGGGDRRTPWIRMWPLRAARDVKLWNRRFIFTTPIRPPKAFFVRLETHRRAVRNIADKHSGRVWGARSGRRRFSATTAVSLREREPNTKTLLVSTHKELVSTTFYFFFLDFKFYFMFPNLEERQQSEARGTLPDLLYVAIVMNHLGFIIMKWKVEQEHSRFWFQLNTFKLGM